MRNHSILALVFAGLIALPPGPLYAAQLNTSSTLKDIQPPPTVPVPETQFAPAIDDLPLMPGLEPVPNEAMLFVAPGGGRLAESDAEGSIDVDDVYRFYRRALPQLGWKMVDNRHYIRSGEHLRIDAHADGKLTSVRFSVKPQ